MAEGRRWTIFKGPTVEGVEGPETGRATFIEVCPVEELERVERERDEARETERLKRVAGRIDDRQHVRDQTRQSLEEGLLGEAAQDAAFRAAGQKVSWGTVPTAMALGEALRVGFQAALTALQTKEVDDAV